MIPFLGFSQEKPLKYFDLEGNELTREDFFKSKDFDEVISLYFENDSIRFGTYIKRKIIGKLNESELIIFKSFLQELDSSKFDSTKNIVLNYISENPKKTWTKPLKYTWNIYNVDYLTKLHKLAEINQYWIISPKNEDIEYYRNEKLNCFIDKDNFIKDLFFIYEINCGNFVIIKPNGEYLVYLGEYGKSTVWESVKMFIL